MAVSRVCLHRFSLSISSIPPYISHLRPRIRHFAAVSASSHSTPNSTSTDITTTPPPSPRPRWKPMCLYFTQSLCTKMDDLAHLNAFSHTFSEELNINAAADMKHVRPQQFDHFLVLDLEGKVEILEFPVLMIDAKTLAVVDFFHRFVRPSEMGEQRINQYIEGKYGKIGVQSVWHDTAIPFTEVIKQFEDWMAKHQLWAREYGGHLNKAAFITCGNWDIKTKIPEQCKVSRMKTPSYFMEWINLKDIYLNFYKRRASGMMTMMRELHMPLVGSHHLGIDDTKNITRVLRRLINDGAVLQITAQRNSTGSVEFLFENRIR
ncbi:hypothetical protein DCAR_0519571 [Daucus carota subsp. sativus]|uniref:Uncharacterized protein n=1 Tax=Daucus carota subsp. sativus TaxID=79200 RepID=A0A164Y286_DAUCS|nr:PREDICTED: uncharacterized exonuclease domain-containing protein At3g15140 isoform X2 [Daucus carota subsp. sativus]WOH00213.1 hypothetical protein DCAR_0519571 [Daucus carota subsp. sativus]